MSILTEFINDRHLSFRYYNKTLSVAFRCLECKTHMCNDVSIDQMWKSPSHHGMCVIMTSCTRFQFNEIETFFDLFEVYGSMIHAMRQQFKLLIKLFKSNHCSSHQPSKSRTYMYILSLSKWRVENRKESGQMWRSSQRIHHIARIRNKRVISNTSQLSMVTWFQTKHVSIHFI